MINTPARQRKKNNKQKIRRKPSNESKMNDKKRKKISIILNEIKRPA